MKNCCFSYIALGVACLLLPNQAATAASELISEIPALHVVDKSPTEESTTHKGLIRVSQAQQSSTAIKAAQIHGKSAGKRDDLLKADGPMDGKTYTIPDLNLVMMPIAPGSFSMGSNNGDDNEKPVTQVTLTRPFWLGKTEVTQSQWEALMGNNPSIFKGSDRPVEKVSWEDAMNYCRKLTQRERAAGRLPEGYEYTLPTEAQWEYACRAGTTGDYAGNLDSMGWCERDSEGQTHPVGQKQANALGLYDMHGNVAEWCADRYDHYPGG